MSVWNIGINDISEETRAFKDQLSSKDAQIAYQENQILKKSTELGALKETLNEAIRKLHSETQRVLRLEHDLSQREADLKNEKNVVQNTQNALEAAHEKIKVKELEAKELEMMLESVSRASNVNDACSLKLEREKAILEARVRELEATPCECYLPQSAQSHPTSAQSPLPSMSESREQTLEQGLADVRAILSAKEADIQSATQKVSLLQNDLLKIDNEKTAMEKRMKAQVEDLQISLEDKNDELKFLRECQGKGDREDELMKRIDEDDAKISALELALKMSEEKFQEELHMASENKHCLLELLKEKEEALSALKLALLDMQLREAGEANDRDESVKHTLNSTSESSTVDNVVSLNMDSEILGASQLSPVQQITGEQAIDYIDKLLTAVDRLRRERDHLRRDVQFLESESRFAIEALEAKLSASASTSSSIEEPAKTIDQLKAEMDGLGTQLAEMAQLQATTEHERNVLKRRLSLTTMAFSVIVQHTQTNIATFKDDNLRLEDRLKAEEARFSATLLCLQAASCECDDLKCKLKDAHDRLEQAAHAKQAIQDSSQEAALRLTEVSHQLDEAEAERDSLKVQLANFANDLAEAQQELNNAESRYSSLQFHQLSNMSSDEAVQTLRDQIEELEMRVMRRTEQVGIHQHDIRRLETNLRLQEERIGEMTAELETLSAQKDAMVEDCADARDARDAALTAVERLEDEVERLEVNAMHGKMVVDGLIKTVMDTICRARQVQRLASKPESSIVSPAEHNVQNAVAITETVNIQNGTLQQEIDALRRQLEEQTISVRSLADGIQKMHSHLFSSVSHLMDSSDQRTIIDLGKSNGEFQQSLEDTLLRFQEIEKAYSLLEMRHVDETQALEAAAAETRCALQDLRSKHATASIDFQERITTLSTTNQLLEEELVKAKSASFDNQENFNRVQNDHAKEMHRLQDELGSVTKDAHEIRKTYEGLQMKHQQLLNELASTTESHTTVLRRVNDELLAAHSAFQLERSGFQLKLDRQSEQLTTAQEEIQKLTKTSQEEIRRLAESQEKLASELRSLIEEKVRTIADSSLLEQEVIQLRSKLSEREEELRSLQEEMVLFQEQKTALDAEMQRSKSLVRFLEKEIADGEHKATSLRTELEIAKADLARSEKLMKTAEVNLSLQTAQYKRETAELQHELLSIRSKGDLEQVVSALQQRIGEMEEMLRAKCAEIEENDDRALEMMKENKKLVAKIEALTRKVQNLKSKQTGSKLPAQQPTSGSSVTADAVSMPLGSHDLAQNSSTFVVQTRIASGPSSLPRPKTPERRISPAIVFKPRTPDRDAPVAQDLVSSAVVAGKKRRAPEDFEGCDGIPPQAFTPDSIPRDVKTPRSQRVLSGLQSGFTPVRHQTKKSMSPKAASSSSRYISDLTNSPRLLSHSAKSAKKGWLGKIRGASSQAAGATLQSFVRSGGTS